MFQETFGVIGGKGTKISITSITDVLVCAFSPNKTVEQDDKVTYPEMCAHLPHLPSLSRGYKSFPAICHFHRLWLCKVPARRQIWSLRDTIHEIIYTN